MVEPSLLRGNAFDAFMADRQQQLLGLIEQATGKTASAGDVCDEGENDEADEDTAEAEMTITITITP